MLERAPLPWALRDLLARRLPRWLAVWLGIRRLSPGRRWPGRSVNVPGVDTGGAYRPKHRRQDPSVDPTEPYGGESSSVGNDHGWSGCTMSAGADAIAYQQPRGALTPWGGDLRHRQGDLSGGTDLYDLRQAWAELGETLTIKTGAGWSGVVGARDDGRAIVVQGEGNVPGSQSFDGGHACSIAPESASSGDWLFGDPLASDWQWVSPSSIRTWMERMSEGCYFAVGEKPPAEPKPPEPPPPAEPLDAGAARADGYRMGVRDGEAAHVDAVFRSWHPGRLFDPPADYDDGARWGVATWGPTVHLGDAWAAWPLPLEAVYRAQYPARWSSAGWAASVWRG